MDDMFEVPGFRLREMTDQIRQFSGQLDAVYTWLVHDLHFPFDTSTSKPEWLDVNRLAEEWLRTEPETHATLEDWLWDIHDTTRWPR